MAKGKFFREVGRLLGFVREIDPALELAKSTRIAAAGQVVGGIKIIIPEGEMLVGIVNAAKRGNTVGTITASSIMRRAGMLETSTWEFTKFARAAEKVAVGSRFIDSAKKLVDIAKRLEDATLVARLRAQQLFNATMKGKDATVTKPLFEHVVQATNEVAALTAEAEAAALEFEASIGAEQVGAFVVGGGITGSDPQQGQLPENPINAGIGEIIKVGAKAADVIDAVIFGAANLGGRFVTGQSVDTEAALEKAVDENVGKLDKAFGELEQQTKAGVGIIENSIQSNSGWGM